MSASHVEHPSRVSRWQDGAFVVHEDAAAEDCTVWFFVERADDGGSRWEGLLARRLAPDRARVCAIPVFAYGVHLGDEVALVESAEGAPVATHTVVESGNETFRVYFGESRTAPVDERLWRELMVELEPLEYWFDVYAPGLVALSAPRGTADEVRAYLQKRKDRSELLFESGNATY